jgi:methyl-accepting chemotaxis protein
MPERIIALSQQLSSVATRRVEDIRQLTRMTKILALNAAIEAAPAGEAGAGFAIASSEVGNVSEKIKWLLEHLTNELADKTA